MILAKKALPCPGCGRQPMIVQHEFLGGFRLSCSRLLGLLPCVKVKDVYKDADYARKQWDEMVNKIESAVEDKSCV